MSSSAFASASFAKHDSKIRGAHSTDCLESRQFLPQKVFTAASAFARSHSY